VYVSRRERERAEAARAARPDLYAEGEGGEPTIVASAAEVGVETLNLLLLPAGRRLAAPDPRLVAAAEAMAERRAGVQPWLAPLRV
jgi:hypothetical protein